MPLCAWQATRALYVFNLILYVVTEKFYDPPPVKNFPCAPMKLVHEISKKILPYTETINGSNYPLFHYVQPDDMLEFHVE